MLTVYGVSGRMFRGSLEQLRQIGPVGAVPRSHAAFAVERGGREAEQAVLEAAPGLKPVAPHSKDSRVALTAYTAAQKPEAERRPMRRVIDIMTRPAFTVRDTATVHEAWHSLARHGVGQAPVVDLHGSLVGLMSRSDLMQLDQLPGPDQSALVWRAMLLQTVAQRMQTPVPAVAPEADIRWVARALLDSELPGLPVVDEAGGVVGFVSRTDILRAVVNYPPLDLWG